MKVEAADIDPESFSWLVFNGANRRKYSGFNQRHSLILEKGDVFGVRRTRTLTYQIVRADAMHIMFRNIDGRLHDNIMKYSVPYKGPTPSAEIEEGFQRHARRSTQLDKENRSNKRLDDYFRPSRKIVEKTQIDRANYQWRRIKAPSIRIETKKQGRPKGVLKTGDIVGMRYMTPAKGGYLLLENDDRINISHELYSDIVHKSSVLDSSHQRTGVIDLLTGVEEPKPVEKKPLKRPVKNSKTIPPILEEPVQRLYDIDGLDDGKILEKAERRSRIARRLSRSVRKMLSVPDVETWVDGEDGEDFEDNPFENPQEPENVEPEQSVDVEPEEEHDEDTGAPEESEETEADEPVVDVFEPGRIIKMLKGNEGEYVIVEAQPLQTNENVIQYLLFKIGEDADEAVLHRLRLDIRTTMSRIKQSVTVLDKTYDAKRLSGLQKTAEYAEFKPVSLVK